VERLRNSEDDESIILSIMDQYGQMVHRVLYSYVKDKHIAEDIAQEVFISTYQNLHKFKEQSAISTWIYRIAVNKAKDYLKSAWFRRTTYSVSQLLLKREKSAETVALSVINNEDLLQNILDLPLKYREVILLYYIEEMKINEISNVLQLNENTIRTRINRGKERLAKSMQKEEVYNEI
jgi:RNA polymerase sigma-70 factor, ECF subfamily